MSPKSTAILPPESLGKAGKRFWKQTVEAYELADAHHLRLLENAALCLDRAVSARERIDAEGVTTTNRFGELREHPACNTERQAMQVFRQTVRELGLDVEPAPMRGPGRPGARY